MPHGFHLTESHAVFYGLSQSRRLPLLQVVSNNKSFSVGVQSLTEINAPQGKQKSGVCVFLQEIEKLLEK